VRHPVSGRLTACQCSSMWHCRAGARRRRRGQRRAAGAHTHNRTHSGGGGCGRHLHGGPQGLRRAVIHLNCSLAEQECGASREDCSGAAHTMKCCGVWVLAGARRPHLLASGWPHAVAAAELQVHIASTMCAICLEAVTLVREEAFSVSLLSGLLIASAGRSWRSCLL
jgi:hypothetical protein